MPSTEATWTPGLAFLSADVVWEALPGVPGLGELYRGRAEVREWIEQLFELAEGGIHTEIEQLTDLGDDRVSSRSCSLHAVGVAASRLRCPTGR
jgi:ketosteroid isomerase-like protein